jgi:hypothetical protein
VKRLITTALCIGLLFASTQGIPCSYVSVKTVEEAATRSDAVFVGWVTALELDDGSWTEKRVRFRITESWKGTEGEYVTVRTGMGGSCGVDYQLAHRYVVFARLHEEGGLSTTTGAEPTDKYSIADISSALGSPKEEFDWIHKPESDWRGRR